MLSVNATPWPVVSAWSSRLRKIRPAIRLGRYPVAISGTIRPPISSALPGVRARSVSVARPTIVDVSTAILCLPGSPPHHQPTPNQLLRDLDCVQSRALAEVVGDDPEVEAVRGEGVLADAADERFVDAGGVEGGRAGAAVRILLRRSRVIDDPDAWEGVEGSA